MPPPPHLRARRVALGLSQAKLAAQVQVSRQALGAIEAGRAVPGVDVALRLARALEAQVEALFGAGPVTGPPTVGVELAEGPLTERLQLTRLRGRWIGHAMVPEAGPAAADALLARRRDTQAEVETLRPLRELEDHVLLLGCASALGVLADRLNRAKGPGTFSWVPRTSTAALAALGRGHTLLAGLHLVDARTGEANVAHVRRLEASEPIRLVTLATWQVGLVVRPSDRGKIQGIPDLARRGVRLAVREPGAGAQHLLERHLRQEGLPLAVARRAHYAAAGHLDLARAVARGAADAGVATRDAALAFGLDFLPLAEERYDVAFFATEAGDVRLERLFDTLVSAPFRRELDRLGYDARPAGGLAAEVRGGGGSP